MFDLSSEFSGYSCTMRSRWWINSAPNKFFLPPNIEWIEIEYKSFSHRPRSEICLSHRQFLPVAPTRWENNPYCPRQYTNRMIKKLRQLVQRLRGIGSKEAKNIALGGGVIARHSDESKANLLFVVNAKCIRGVFTNYPCCCCERTQATLTCA